MKRTILGLAAALLTATVAFAAPPGHFGDSSLGKVLVGDNGMTLYIWDKDAVGVSNCYDKCAENWPPLIAAADAAAEGDWTLVDRKDGTKQWAYDGKPVYYYGGDAKAGDATGDGIGGVWHVIKE